MKNPFPLQITIVTFAWPPRNTIAVHRPYSWAKYWSREGHFVRVLTAHKYSYDAPLDLDLEPIDGVDVLELEYDGGAKSLATLAASSPFAALAAKLYRRSKYGAAQDINPRRGWLTAALPHVEQLAQNCDVVVSTFDPKATHLIAAAFKRANPKITWVADYRDPWSQSSTARWSDSQREEERRQEVDSVGRYADLITSAFDEMTQELASLLGRPALTVTNGFDRPLSQVEIALAALRPKTTLPLKIVYTGKIYPGLQDPMPLLQAVEEGMAEGVIERDAVEVHLYGGQADVPAGPYDHLLRKHGHVRREIALKAQSDADLLLLLDSPSGETRGVLRGKMFEYIASGVPILSVGSGPSSATARVLAETGTGVCVHQDCGQIKTILTSVIAGRGVPGFLPHLPAIAKYSRESQALAMLKHIVDRVQNGEVNPS